MSGSEADASAEVAASGAAYVFNPSIVPVLARLADEACAGMSFLALASSRIHELAAGLSPPVDATAVRELAASFYYRLVLTRGDAPKADARLEPVDNMDWNWPRPMRMADENVRALWAALAKHVTHPAARSLFSDILFSLRIGNGRDNADRAARGYMDALGGDLEPVHQVEGLVRAWTLARSVGLAELEGQITRRMQEMAVDGVARREAPGVVIPLLVALAEPHRRRRATRVADREVDELLDQALTVYPDSYLVAEIAALIRKRAGTNSQRAAMASRAEVEAHLREAGSAEPGLAQMAHLQQAASAARRLGVADLEAAAVSRMQSAPPIQWTVISHDVTIPASKLESFLRQFTSPPDWRTAIARWMNLGPPTGRLANNEAAARAALDASVLQRLARLVVYSESNMPERTVMTDDERFQHQLAQQESMQCRMSGLLLASALNRVKQHYGTPSRTEVTAFLTDRYRTDAWLAQSLATAFDLFWHEDYEASAHLAIPKIEAAARGLLLELDEPLYRTELGSAHGQFPGLGVLLPPLLAHGLDPDWERFLGTFLLSRGSNIRNLICHGFIHDVAPGEAALILRACALLVLIAPSDTVQRNTQEVKALLAQPTQHRHTPKWRRIGNAIRAGITELRQP